MEVSEPKVLIKEQRHSPISLQQKEMEIKVLNKKEGKISFLVRGIDTSIANSLRRSIQEIPTLAIDEVEFIKNDSALFDEIIAHRLGLLPLKTEKVITAREECSCKGKGCSKCTIALKLKIKGPCTVYASDFKGKDLIVYKKMPIVMLSKDQELELNAYAKMGTGKKHTKFSPGLVYFKPLAEIKFSKECDFCNECVKTCPLNLLSAESRAISFNNIEECDLCEACVEACRKHGKNAISLIASKEDFIFVIESWGQLSVKEIFVESCKIIEKNLKELDKKLSKL